MAESKEPDSKQKDSNTNTSSPATAASAAGAPAAQSASGKPPVATGGAESGSPQAPKPGVRRKRRKTQVVQKEVKKDHPVVAVLKRLKQFFELQGLPLIRELYSPDFRTRKMTVYFLMSVAGFLALCGTIVLNCGSSKLVQLWSFTQESARERTELLHKQRERADQEASWIKLDKFAFDLRRTASDYVGSRISRVVELDLAIQGDSPETSSFIEENEIAARNAIYKAVVGWDRDTLMTPEGKKKLREAIAESLNSWLPEGNKVVDVFFTRFLFK